MERSRKKRNQILSSFLVMLLLVGLLSGCGGDNSPPQTDSTEPPSSGTADDPTEPQTNWEISQNHSKAGFPKAYLLDEIKVPTNGYISSISVQEDRAAVIQADFYESETLTVYDLRTKQPLWAWMLEADSGSVTAGFLSDGSVYLYRSAQETVTVYNEGGEETLRYSGIAFEGNLYADEDLGLWLIQKGNLLLLKDGTQQSYPLIFSGSAPIIASVKDGAVLYACWMENTYAGRINTVTGEQEWLSHLEGFTAGNGLLYKVDSQCFFYSLDGDHVYEVSLPAGVTVLGADRMQDWIVIRDTQKTLLLQPKTGELMSVNGTMYPAGMVGGEVQNVLLRSMTAAGETVCILTGFEANKPSLTITEWQLTTEQLANRETAKMLQEKYGIYVRWLPCGAGRPISGTYVTVDGQTDQEVTEFLQALRTALERFPPNLFQTITKGNVRSVFFCSVNGIAGGGDNSLTSAGALTCAVEDSVFLVFSTADTNVTDLGDTAFAHELLHLFESTIELDYPDEARFAPWQELNPAGFTYRDYYSDDWGSWEYVFDYYSSDLSNAYFASQYGKINALEDRATIFESMCLPTSRLFESPHIYAKAEFLNGLLKECYPELYENGEPIWLNYQ